MGTRVRALGISSLLLSLSLAAEARSFESVLIDSSLAQSYSKVAAPTLADTLEADGMSAYDGNLVALNSSDLFTLSDCGCYDCPPVWTVRAGAVILDRSKPEDNVIAQPLGGLLAVSAGGDYDFGWSGGFDVYVARQTPGWLGAEFRYFNVDFDARYDYGDTGDIQIGHTTVTSLLDVESRYGSQLQSAEFNVRVPTSQRVTWLAGFRWFELQERLNYDIDLLGFINNDFRWNTNNDLYGGQLGLDLQLWDLRSPLSITTSMKAGVYGNDGNNNFSFHVDSIPILRGGASNGDVAFAGDIAVNLTYQMTRHVGLMGGYQLLWISGTALASDQAATTLHEVDTDIINTNGDVFYHGAITGVVFSW